MKCHTNPDPASTVIDYPYFARSLLRAHKWKPLKQIMEIAEVVSNGQCDLNKLWLELLFAMQTEELLSDEEFEKIKKDIRCDSK